MLGSENADEDYGTDNDNNGRNHGEDKVDIGEKILQSFHELLIAVYIWFVPRDFSGRGNGTYRKIELILVS